MRISFIVPIITLFVTIYYVVDQNVRFIHNRTKVFGKTLLLNLREINTFIGDGEDNPPTTFNKQMERVVVQYDQEFRQIKNMMETTEQFLHKNNQFSEEVKMCVSLMKELELDYFDLQRRSIGILYQEREMLSSITNTFPQIWEAMLSGGGGGGGVEIDVALHNVDKKISNFRDQINEIVHNQFTFLNKSQQFESLMMQKSIATKHPNLFFDKLSMFIYGSSGLGMAYSLRCGTTPWCLFKTISSFLILENQALVVKQNMDIKTKDSNEASNIIGSLIQNLSEIINYLRIKVKQYDLILLSIHNLDTKQEIGGTESLESIKESIDRCIVDINVFLA